MVAPFPNGWLGGLGVDQGPSAWHNRQGFQSPLNWNCDRHRRFWSHAYLAVCGAHNRDRQALDFTSPWRISGQVGIRVSMDGKGRYRDTIFVERLWRTVKYEEVYLKAYQDGRDARIGIREYFRFYNTERPHQALGYRTPAEVFASRPMEATNEGIVESPILDTLRTAGHDLNNAPVLS